MKNTDVQSKIESHFRKQVQADKKIKNAYLLVESEKLGVKLNIAEGKTGDFDAHPQQPNHLASVGKLFTATLIGILHDKGELSFDDPIAKYLDDELMQNLHVFNGRDYSSEIKIFHLLNQTSGLDEVFFPLLDKMIKDPGYRISTREAILWGKQNLKPKAEPGKKHLYGDTNYYLLGLIVESIRKKSFQEVMHQLVFDPLGMEHAYMNDFTKPQNESPYPTAGIYLNKIDFADFKGIAPLDYAGASVIAPLDEYLIFMKALVNNKILKEETLQRMMDDDRPMGFPNIGISYGYSIWKFVTVPVIMPEKFNCWGCVGVTGAFMFYHPKTEAYIIGTFNDSSWKSKAIRFMLAKVVRELLGYQKSIGL